MQARQPEQGNQPQPDQELKTQQKNYPQENQLEENMGAIAITTISKTPLASFPGNPSDEIVYLNSLCNIHLLCALSELIL